MRLSNREIIPFIHNTWSIKIEVGIPTSTVGKTDSERASASKCLHYLGIMLSYESQSNNSQINQSVMMFNEEPGPE